ncbi:MAG: ABC transporter ATP-binding protein [Spirochaetaceae bacterium]|nr:ABC transporter ATP-binding protein [Spirochaetaceae bacterium]
MLQPVLEMRNITKRFPGVMANDRVNLALYPGEIHALLGENGAGKSTLMNILMGIYAPNEGSIFLNGKQVVIKNPKDAVRMRIGMVHQHFKLIEPLTVAENVLLCSNRCRYVLNTREMYQQIRDCSRQFNLAVDPGAKIWQLSVGEQQRVEIVKQLFAGADILILDEPTSVLTPQETAELFKTLRAMVRQGKTVLFITHKLYEVMTYGDRITVLRDGRSIDTGLTADTDRRSLAHLMVGRELQSVTGRPERIISGDPVLRLEGVRAMGDRGHEALKGINLDIRRGEILGIAGVAGNGQRELSEVITGLRKPLSGKVYINGEDISGSTPRQCTRRGIGFIPEDRMGMGLVGTLDMLDNVILRDYDSDFCNRRGLLNKKGVARRAEDFVNRYAIKNTGVKKPVSLMSGGNLQKLLIAREISGDPKLLVASYPVHGVDIGATEAIHRILMEQRDRGAAILLISEDLEELFEMSDRVAALYGGRITGIVEIHQVTQETYNEVGRLMLGLEARPDTYVPEAMAQ